MSKSVNFDNIAKITKSVGIAKIDQFTNSARNAKVVTYPEIA